MWLAVYGLLNACTNTNQPVNAPTPKTEVKHEIKIEPQKGRISPEISIARSIKYNLNNLKHLSLNKFLGSEAQSDAFNNLKKIKENSSGGASVSLKELDFSILYALTNYYQEQDKIDNLFNQTISQNLTQAALKSHKSTLYANKKIFEIKRKIRQYQKQLTILIKKQSPSDVEYKKTLETSIDTLKQIQQTLEQDINNFKQLTHINNKKIELDGKRFFSELSLPANSQSTDLQMLAFNNTSNLKDFTQLPFDKISELVTTDYDVNDSKIKGFHLQDASYVQKLAINGDNQANKLLQITLDYKKANHRKKEKLKEKFSNELHKAIFLQIEIAHALAIRSNIDYHTQKENIKSIKQEIKKLEKVSNKNNQQKIKILQLHINLINNENLADQILGERSAIISALKFYTKEISISPKFLSKDITTMSIELKKSLLQKNQKLEKTAETNNIPKNKEHWTKGDNWLEELMSSPQPLPSPTKTKSTPINNPIDYNKFTILQLGAYIEKETAEKEWKKLSAQFPELRKYQPIYEKNYITGIELTRLYIKSPTGGFKSLCNKIRAQHYECLLHD